MLLLWANRNYTRLVKMSTQLKAYLALLYICIIWGTTFLVIRIGITHYPPLLFAGVRQVLAGAILIPMALSAGRKADWTKANVLRQMLIGFLMLTVGNGGVTWAELYIPSGIAALLCALMPIVAVLLNLASSSREKLNTSIVSGMLLGVAGVALIFRQSLADLANPRYLGGMIVTILGTSGWALGSTISKRHSSAINPLFNSGLQLAFGGVFMLLLSPLTDDYSNIDVFNTDGLLALAYLVLLGSVIAYSAYMFALKNLPVGIATIYAYINPLIAVVAGYFFLSEPLNVYIALAFVAIVSSVFIVNSGYRKQQRLALAQSLDKKPLNA